MDKKQLILLFIIVNIIMIAGSGMIPLLPVRIIQLGASEAVSGYFMALAFMSISLAFFFTGWLANKTQHKRLVIGLSGAVFIPVMGLMSQAKTVTLFAILTTITWFLAGIAWAMSVVIAGLQAKEQERGKVFGILGLNVGIGSLVGGLLIGFLVNKWGYETMFLVMAVFMLAWVIAGLLLKEPVQANVPDVPPESSQPVGIIATSPPQKVGDTPGLGRSFYLLFFASIIISITIFECTLIRSLLMDRLKFSAMAISSTAVIAGIVSIPATLLSGWLSDRLGRRLLILFSYFFGIIGVVLLLTSTALWHFWLVITLGTISGTIGTAVNPAYTADLTSERNRGLGMSMISTAGNLGAIIGFGMTGVAIQHIGLNPTILIGAVLPLISIALLMGIGKRR